MHPTSPLGVSLESLAAEQTPDLEYGFASTFTGIGGLDAPFHDLGWHCTAMSEINEHCQTLLAKHFPTTPLMGDIRNVQGTHIGRPRLLLGGFPCTDTSIAAPHRLGLDGERSGLFYEFKRLLAEHLRIADEANPRWVVIENPEGLLTSNGGRDMAAVVGGLGDLGYGWAYRVVDGRHLGTTQRRRRVLVVGHRGGDPRPAWAVLADGEGRGEAAAAHQVRRGPARPPLADSDSGRVGPDTLIWRKSARARKSLAAGGYETWVPAEHGNTLNGYDGGGPLRQTHLIAQGGRVRTLTLTEWERLQGFPDGWTDGIPESARYTALGNAVHTGTAAWLARRLDAFHRAIPQLEAATSCASE